MPCADYRAVAVLAAAPHTVEHTRAVVIGHSRVGRLIKLVTRHGQALPISPRTPGFDLTLIYFPAFLDRGSFLPGNFPGGYDDGVALGMALALLVHGEGSVGATFQLGAMFGVGRCGGVEKTSLISLTSEERWTRPHMG